MALKLSLDDLRVESFETTRASHCAVHALCDDGTCGPCTECSDCTNCTECSNCTDCTLCSVCSDHTDNCPQNSCFFSQY